MAVRENRNAGQSMKGRQKRKCGVWPNAKTGTMGAPAWMASLRGRECKDHASCMHTIVLIACAGREAVADHRCTVQLAGGVPLARRTAQNRCASSGTPHPAHFVCMQHPLRAAYRTKPVHLFRNTAFVPLACMDHFCGSPHKAGALLQEHHLLVLIWLHVKAPGRQEQERQSSQRLHRRQQPFIVFVWLRIKASTEDK